MLILIIKYISFINILLLIIINGVVRLLKNPL